MHHGGCGYNRKGCLSTHSVFVIHKDGTPITPTKSARAKKLMKTGVAKPVWNKFGQFGIQMLVETRKEIPNTAMGIDNGTVFEGYSVVCGKENNINVMWKLPDKKNIVDKITEKKLLRRERRRRNKRKRAWKWDNRKIKSFIAPSQLVIVNSRLKAIKEILKTYPIKLVGIEDVIFNHAKNKNGKNFSTIEYGKNKIYEFIEKYAILHKFRGFQTQKLRKLYGYAKVKNKSTEKFSAHCCDSLALAIALTTNNHIDIGKFIIVDDSYRPVRRRLHYTNSVKSNIRRPYSKGNFMSMRKGSMCNFGLFCGGTKTYIRIYNWSHKRTAKSVKKIKWLSKRFFIKNIDGIRVQRQKNGK
jgi:hypothetical protein